MSNKKYELIPTQLFSPEGKPLFQLRALRDFADIRLGDLGGLIEGEHNLPHDGTAWVHADATLYGSGYVSDGTPKISVAVRPTKPPSIRPRSGFVFR